MAVVGLPFPQQISTLAAQDADFFGLSIPSCEAYGWEKSLAAIKESGGRVSYLCHGPTVSAKDDEGWAKQIQLLTRAVELAHKAEIPWVYFTTGRQGRLLWEDAAQRWAARIKPLAQYANERGVGIVLENTIAIRSDISFTHSVRDTATLARMVGAHLCVDLYCCFGEAGLEETLEHNRDRIAIVQVSDLCIGDLDLPNRQVLGEGDLPLEELLQMVGRTGYEGLLDIELIGPRIGAYGVEAALRRSITWLTNRFNELND